MGSHVVSALIPVYTAKQFVGKVIEYEFLNDKYFIGRMFVPVTK